MDLGISYVLVSPDTSSFSVPVQASGRHFRNMAFVLVFNQSVPGQWKMWLLSGLSPVVPDRLPGRYLLIYFADI